MPKERVWLKGDLAENDFSERTIVVEQDTTAYDYFDRLFRQLRYILQDQNLRKKSQVHELTVFRKVQGFLSKQGRVTPQKLDVKNILMSNNFMPVWRDSSVSQTTSSSSNSLKAICTSSLESSSPYSFTSSMRYIWNTSIEDVIVYDSEDVHAVPVLTSSQLFKFSRTDNILLKRKFKDNKAVCCSLSSTLTSNKFFDLRTPVVV